MRTILLVGGVPVALAVAGLLVACDLMSGRRAHLDLDGYSESLYPQRFGWSPLFALGDGRFKLIDAPSPELYDLQRDPFEERNLYDERRAVAEALTRRLAMLARGRAAARADANEPALPSAELRQRLAALGYVGSLPTGPLRFREALPDPKDCIGLHSLRLGTGSLVPAGATARCK